MENKEEVGRDGRGRKGKGEKRVLKRSEITRRTPEKEGIREGKRRKGRKVEEI